MVDFAQHVRLHHFVEEMGLLIEQSGGARMMGRMIGYLLICDPPEQSASDLAEALHASAGSVSQTTRQLLAAGMVERVARPGDRKIYVRFRDGAYVDMMRGKAGILSVFREVCDAGLRVLEDAPPAQRARLQDFRDFYAFMESEIPGLIARWHAHRDAAAAAQED